MNINSIIAANQTGINRIGRSEDMGTDRISDFSEFVPEKSFDGYFPSEEDRPIGLYKLSEDENGNPHIDYDSPDDKEKSEKCTANTDKVDREIKKLKEKAAQLRQQIRSASEDKRKKLETQLQMVEAELSQKDNDGYRRENTVFSAFGN